MPLTLYALWVGLLNTMDVFYSILQVAHFQRTVVHTAYPVGPCGLVSRWPKQSRWILNTTENNSYPVVEEHPILLWNSSWKPLLRLPQVAVSCMCSRDASALINISCEWTATGKTFQRPFRKWHRRRAASTPFLPSCASLICEWRWFTRQTLLLIKRAISVMMSLIPLLVKHQRPSSPVGPGIDPSCRRLTTREWVSISCPTLYL